MGVAESLKSEIDHHYGTGRVAIGVDGAPGAGAAALADELAEAYRASGREVRRASADVDLALFRERVLAPFRHGGDVLVVDGSRLLAQPWAGMWNFTVYVDSADAPNDPDYVAETGPFFAASAVIDTTDPANPKRVLTDSC